MRWRWQDVSPPSLRQNCVRRCAQSASPTEGAGGTLGAAPPNRRGRIVQDMAGYGRIWQDMAGYGGIWRDMVGYSSDTVRYSKRTGQTRRSRASRPTPVVRRSSYRPSQALPRIPPTCDAWQWEGLTHPLWTVRTNTSGGVTWAVRRSAVAGGGVQTLGFASVHELQASPAAFRAAAALNLRSDRAAPPRSLLLVSSNDAGSDNVWHRMTAVFSAWLTVEVAKRRQPMLAAHRFDVTRLNGGLHPDFGTLFGAALRPAQARGVPYSHVLIAPPDGFLWDLAWDNRMACRSRGSSIWRGFVSALRTALGAPSGPGGATRLGQAQLCLMRRPASSPRRLRPAELRTVATATKTAGWNLIELHFRQRQTLRSHALAMANW